MDSNAPPSLCCVIRIIIITSCDCICNVGDDEGDDSDFGWVPFVGQEAAVVFVLLVGNAAEVGDCSLSLSLRSS